MYVYVYIHVCISIHIYVYVNYCLLSTNGLVLPEKTRHEASRGRIFEKSLGIRMNVNRKMVSYVLFGFAFLEIGIVRLREV